MPQKSITSDEKAVIKAETLMTEFFVKMNLPLSSADTFSRIVKVAFPDSTIAKKYECGRSKTTAIVKELSVMTKQGIVDRMKSRPFSIATDGSNDQKDKQFPIVVTTVSPENTVQVELLNVPVLQEAATGQNIFNLLNRELHHHNIPWKNCISFGTDNASVMTGNKKGVFKFLLDKQPSSYLSGCPCHLIHHAAEKAASALPFSIEAMLVDTYYYLDKSSKRQLELDKLQTLYEVEHHKILKHVSTRWLSIERCLERILENWDPLKVYFVSDKTLLNGTKRQSNLYKQTKITALEEFYRSPTNRLFCLFLKFAVQPLDKINTILQAEKPLIHTLNRLLKKLFRELLVRFIVPVAFKDKEVHLIAFEEATNHKKNEDLIIGDKARDFILKKTENHLRNKRVDEFYAVVKQVYVAACKYIRDKLPLDAELLKHAEVADIDLKLEKTSTDVTFFLTRFPAILPTGYTKEQVILEFAEYQCEEVSHLKKERADDTWRELAALKDTEGVQRFPSLPTVMVSILTIPHSNASCERIFSCVRKNKTPQRASMGSETLEALMVVKSHGTDLHQRDYSGQQLVKLKSAYYRSLKCSFKTLQKPWFIKNI